MINFSFEKNSLFSCIPETKIELSDVVFGDIWLCSGQSNMEMQMKSIANASEEIENSADFNIRFTVISNKYSLKQDDFLDTPIEVPWSDASQSNRLRLVLEWQA